ncbi:glutamate--tRNA ligase [Roseomonas alkaliterrae]|uniref:Glutamate--tRNA ligase n=1 Tax=Neoroseomonas alkaliterrae TaxID=1452450 RepID=A0A840XNU3_9PROT|nr:glutamate--tRNA ligase [Neoroseomonas alkaliterrae]MBB5690258.1 glutamyl-tRNA synthetase [Neoroseomonas alkaliterrae]MBR0677253.1 glutamate--tRNA ligase [Neoroseomonas alkaliterrae]
MKLRFAPSPTGLLHVGNARVALANWLHARRHGGTFVLRLDDTDRERSRPEFAAAIEEDLHWLGLDWDERIAQSARLDRYAAAAERLKQDGRLYPCFETEEELAFKRERRRREGRPPIYDREALKMTPEQIARAIENGKQPYWRFRLSPRSVAWTDLVLGERRVKLSAISDPVLIRADGSPLYTFTSVVDDLEMAVTHVIRGEDHVTNTGIQLDIFEALGGDAARLAFAHLPLLTDEEGGALSKRLGSISLRHLRKDGIEPAALAGYLAALGTSADPVAGMPRDLAPGYDLGRVSHATARFDTRHLLALNRRVLHEAPFAAVRDRLPEGADEAFWLAVRGNLDLLREARPWFDILRGSIVPPVQEGEHDFLAAALAALPPEPWDGTTWSAWTGALKAATGRKGKALFLPLRLALTGEEQGPDLGTLLPLIGRERAAARLRLAAGA